MAELVEDNRQEQIDEAEAMIRLLEDKDFILLFREKFINAFAITNIQNSWSFDDATRRRFLEKTISRGHLTKFIDDILEDGRNAIMSINEETVNEQEEETY